MSISLEFKEDMTGIPPFRPSKRDAEGAVTTCPGEALLAKPVMAQMGRLGRSAGLPENLTFYCGRRGAGRAIDGRGVPLAAA